MAVAVEVLPELLKVFLAALQVDEEVLEELELVDEEELQMAAGAV